MSNATFQISKQKCTLTITPPHQKMTYVLYTRSALSFFSVGVNMQNRDTSITGYCGGLGNGRMPYAPTVGANGVRL